ncbi:LVIVD repeat-containing protein [Tahibacter amnicola]|uniref:LVIVD repeat-containing protein n=1 Tax=Tahibacter amnicola TaxID=2976241 RepID=A0ABY6BJ63_9GAMM|nr:hypothetical protein [Tahibacter amnicola]UXI69804.1 hypothetical protein N4264_09300 [Tahibacter amnicola]
MRMRALPLALSISVLLAAAGTAAAQPPAAMQFQAAQGGSLNDPVVVDDFVYVAAGSTVSAWQTGAGAPTLRGDTRHAPAPGWLTGLVRRGDYLYASYRVYSGAPDGVAIFSIAERARPRLVGHVDNYTSAPIRNAQSVALAGDHLLLLDSENGIFAAPLTQPEAPVFAPAYASWGHYDHATVVGNRLYTVGRNFISGTVLEIFDITQPTAPQSLGTAGLDGFDNFRLKVKPPYAYGFGVAVAISDLTDPANIVARGRVDSPVAYEGVVLQDVAWSLGLDGLDTWSIANPDAPAARGHFAIDTFATVATAQADSRVLLGTRADRLVQLSAANPLQPTVDGVGVLPGGTATLDAALRGDTLLLLGNAYGLNIADAASLNPAGRYETSIEPVLQARAFEQMHVDGNRAYLASWGSGLVIADITQPRTPVELGRFAFGFASAVTAAGNMVYVGRSTNGGMLQVVDVTNPAQPVARGGLETRRVSRLAHHGHHVFLAGQAEPGGETGGLAVVDVTNPDQPAVVTTYAGCTTALDVSLNQQGTLAAVACGTTTHVIDIGQPANPAFLGEYAVAASTVALRGSTLYVGHDNGVDEVDIHNPAAPVRVSRHDLPAPARRLLAAADSRVFAMTDIAGIYVYASDQLFTDGFSDP